MSSWNNLSMAQRAEVIKLAVQNGIHDLDTIRGAYNEYADGGSIHIKPENRGKFTALKERTGHSATWFKEYGTPAQKKMATFALNSRHWKHGYGGHIYDGTTEDSQQMNTPRYRKLLDAEIKEELSDSDVMELPLAAELSDVRVTGKKKRNVFSQIEEKWIKNDKGEEVPTYWGYNPDTKQKEQLYRLEDGKSSDESVFFTPDGRWSYNVPQAAEMRKAYEQWIKNGAYASGIDEAVLGYLLFGVSPIALPEIAAGALTPVGQTLLAGTLGGEAWEALNHGITGQSWGDNLGDVIGLDKDNYLGRTALGLTNPFYGLSPSMIYRGGEAVLGAGKTALNLAQNTASKSVEALQNKYPALFDPYTSWDATLGYHGDNIFNRAVGTMGRRHGYTPKAEVPEFHRRLDINRPEEFRLTDDGKFVISSGRTGDGHDGIVNFATSEPARGHGNHRRLSGTDDYIINPKVIGNQDFKSIQPSDTFFETGELTINPKDVTIVSGNTSVLDHARSMGMKTLSSPKLRQLTAKRVTKEEIVNDRAKDGLLKFIQRARDIKYGKGKENLENIGREIQRLTSMRGAPTIKDYAYFENMTGLNSGVRPAEMWNGTKEQGLELFGDWGTPLNDPSFNHVAYTPASSIESIYRGAKMGERPWSDYYEALEKMPSAREQLGMTSYPQITAENAANYAPKVNWDADNWFKTISGRNSYSAEEAIELSSHVPEYREIERRLFNEGKLTIDSKGDVIVNGSEMSPQEYIMRQSEAFQKMNPEHHYVGVSKRLRGTFENDARDPATRNRYDVWTDRKSPKNVEEYAISQQGGYTNASQIEKIENQMSIREENYELHKEQLKWKLEHGKISQETYDRDLAALEDNYSIKQKEDGEELKVLKQQEALDPLNGGKVFDVTYPRNTIEAPVIDAEGNHWHSIPYLTVQRDAPVLTSHYQPYDPVNTTVQTDQLVTASRRHGYGVTHIDNVKDTYDGTMLNETIIGRETPVKSVLGNTGTFDIEGANKWRLYRSLLPFGIGLTGYGLYNYMNPTKEKQAY